MTTRVDLRVLSLLALATFMVPRICLACVRKVGPSKLTESAEVIAIIRLESDGSRDQTHEVACTVLEQLRGSVEKGAQITVLYPAPNIALEEFYVPPEKGTTCLVFLRRIPDSEAYEPVFSHQGIKRLTPGRDDHVADSLRQFVQWDQLTADAKTQLAVSALRVDTILRDMMLEMMIERRLARKYDFPDGNIPDDILAALLEIRHDEKARMPAIRLLAMTGRKDLIAYVVEALDNPTTRYFAIHRLQAHLWKPGDPWPPPSSYRPSTDPKLVEEKIAELKKWWAEVASKDPEYKKFVPPDDDRESEQKEAPVEDDTEKLPEDTGTTENHSHASDPLEAGSTEGSITGKPAPAEEHTAASGARTASTDAAEIEEDARISTWLVMLVIGVLCIAAGLWAFIKRK